MNKFEKTFMAVFLIGATCSLFVALSTLDIAFGTDCVIASGVIESKEYLPHNGHGEFRVSVENDGTHYLAQMETAEWVSAAIGDYATVTQRKGRLFSGVRWAKLTTSK